MAEYMAAEIEIGGPITEVIATRLAERADADGLCAYDYGDVNGAGADAIREAINEAAADGEPITLFDNEARFGQFDELEAFCRNNGLSYCRHNDAKYEFDAEFCWWKPGMAEPISCDSDNNQAVLCRADAIRKILNGPGGCIK